MPSPFHSTNPPLTDAALHVDGTLPLGLSGWLVAAGARGLVHSFHFDRGRVSHLVRSIGGATAVNDLVAFDGSILTYSDDASVRQLSLGTGAVRRVDLAGRRRSIVACPIYDAVSGELHLVARDWGGTQLHVAVPPGALIRRTRPLADAPARVQGLAVGNDHVVFVGDGAVGVAPRAGDERARWVAIDAVAPRLVHTHRTGDTVVLVALTPALERWILHVDGRDLERDVFDPTPRRFAHTDGGRSVDGSPGFVWSTGGESISRHDPVRSRSARLDLAPNAPGDFVVVGDPARPGRGAGWFVGLVHHASGDGADLVVIDTAHPSDPLVTAAVRIARSIPRGLRCTWLPAPSH